MNSPRELTAETQSSTEIHREDMGKRTVCYRGNLCPHPYVGQSVPASLRVSLCASVIARASLKRAPQYVSARPGVRFLRSSIDPFRSLPIAVSSLWSLCDLCVSVVKLPLNPLQEPQPPAPGLVVRFLVRVVFVARVFARAHKPVPGAVVGDRIISLARVFHHRHAIRNRLGDARVVAGIEPIDRAVDPGNRFLA